MRDLLHGAIMTRARKEGSIASKPQARETLCPREMEVSSYNLEDEGSALGDAAVDVDLTDASGENASSRASSAAMSRPMTRGTIETRPQSSGSIAIDDGASEHGWGGSSSSELSASVKRLLCTAKDRSATSSSHNMEAIMELYEQTKIATAEAQNNPTCMFAPLTRAPNAQPSPVNRERIP